MIPVAIVTGATSGVGREIVRDLLSKGFHVCAIGRRGDTARLRASSGEHSFAAKQGAVAAGVCHMRADLTDHESVAGLTDFLLGRYTSVDLLVHAAGAFETDEQLLDHPVDADALFRIHVVVPMWLTTRLREALACACGTVVVIGSSAAENPSKNNAIYAGTKAAISAAAKSMRENLNPHGCRVALITLGRTDTPMQKLVQASEGRELEGESDSTFVRGGARVVSGKPAAGHRGDRTHCASSAGAGRAEAHAPHDVIRQGLALRGVGHVCSIAYHVGLIVSSVPQRAAP